MLVSKRTKGGRPVTFTHKKRGVKQVAAAVEKDVKSVRPDLARAAKSAAACAHGAGRRGSDDEE